MENSELTLNQKLSEIQSEISVPKSKHNKFGDYAYRDLEGILKALAPYSKKFGVNVTFDDDVVMVGARIYIKSTATISDGKESISKSAFAREAETKKGMDDSQITGTSSSYARKTAVTGLLGLSGSSDADSRNNLNSKSENKPPKDIGDTKIPFGNNEGLTLKEVSPKELLELCKKIVEVNKSDGTEIPEEEQDFMKTVKTYLNGAKK